jgi:hypothetical protein
MPEFTINTPITTDQPIIEVTIDPARPLAFGRHVFRLVVEDDSGNQSDPDTLTIIVRDNQKPTAVLEGPAQVNLGQTFQLLGRRSTDAGGGRVTKFIWTLVG